jgi:ABC-2 type transport system permease protein
MKKFLAILHARNMEFIRDKSSVGWNILFPLLLVLGFAFVFSGEPKDLYKVGVMGDTAALTRTDGGFFRTKYIQFIPMDNLEKGIDKVVHFQLDMLVDLRQDHRYWVNGNSPNGYILERVFRAEGGAGFRKQVVQGREIRYVDWVVPGILAMNMMFSCLFGVG